MRDFLRDLAWILIALSAISFILAIVTSVTGLRIINVSPEGYSRACTNLALLSIALVLANRKRKQER